MNFEQINKVYFLGIGGIGMSAIARYFLSEKKMVAGYDRTETVLTRELTREGISVHYADDLNLIPDSFKDRASTLVVYTPAVPADHSEFMWFKSHGFEIKKRAEVLGIISRSKDVIGVAGTHGKTTTSTMVAHLLRNSHFDCNAFLGGISLNYNTNLLLSENSNFVVVEADEYDRSFLQLHPKATIVTSMDADHLDIYDTYAEYCAAFYQYISQIQNGGFLVIKKGLEPKSNLSGIQVFTYSLRGLADFYAKNITAENGYYQFDVVTPKGDIKDVKSGFPGLLNVENAVAAIAMGSLLGCNIEGICSAMESFKGVKRRFEYHIKTDKLKFIDDYGHHPEEIRLTIESVKELFPEKKVTGVFQPHLYSRTRDFADDFARSLSLLDEVILLDIYPAREKPIPGVTSDMLLEKITSQKKYLCKKVNLVEFLASMSLPEILITMGAGDIDTFVEPIREMLLSRLTSKDDQHKGTSKKLMKRKIKHIVLWSLMLIYLVVGFGFVGEKQNALVCNKVEVRVVDSLRSGFVLKDNINRLLQKKKYSLIGRNFADINLEALEAEINNYPPVQNAEVYKTADGRVIIEVEQRSPVLRIIDSNNDSYYIDENGFVMRLSGNYTSHVIIANGNIVTKFPITNKTNVLDLEKKAQGRRVVLADLYKLAKYVNNNKFWNAQIQQIFVNFSGDFELIPRVGANVIIFGDYGDCETKFDNLMSLYKHGLPAVGWNKYETINLKFKGQVICTKRE